MILTTTSATSVLAQMRAQLDDASAYDDAGIPAGDGSFLSPSWLDEARTIPQRATETGEPQVTGSEEVGVTPGAFYRNDRTATSGTNPHGFLLDLPPPTASKPNRRPTQAARNRYRRPAAASYR